MPHQNKETNQEEEDVNLGNTRAKQWAFPKEQPCLRSSEHNAYWGLGQEAEAPRRRNKKGTGKLSDCLSTWNTVLRDILQDY